MEDFEYINKELETNFCSMAEVNWTEISQSFKGILSEEFIDRFNDKVDWRLISRNQALSEPFIEKYNDKVDWRLISRNQALSEPFIEKYKDKVVWSSISRNQALSEPFIEKYKDKVDWYYISTYQKLSESFIEKYKDKVDWTYISIYQKLSEEFIEKYQNKVYWIHISMFQKLSEEFIEKFQDKVSGYRISEYQKLSDEFIKRHNLIVKKNSLWQYKDKEFKKEEVIKTGKYECYDDYFIAYKAIRKDRYSIYNFQYQYLPGETYESTCDCTKDENSFGLNVGTYEFAKDYLGNKNGIIVKCKINYEDVGRIVHDGNKVRCFKITILE